MSETPPIKRLAALVPVLLSASLCGCAPNQPGTPYALAPRLPYAACGDMATIRGNLTGERDPSLESDAMLRTLGVRCIGEAPVAFGTRY